MAKDKYANKLVVTCALSAANTLTFQSLNLGISAFDRVGILIHKLGYSLSDSSWVELLVSADNVEIALTSSNTLTSIAQNLRQVFDKHDFIAWQSGTPAAAAIQQQPEWVDFTTLPGGGMLVPASPLYLAAVTAGFAAGTTVYMNIWFSVVQLADADYFELLETTRYQQ